ncbi:tripartite motif-containing protein 2-like isoform X1 [Ptychodera flava]|uniref:tripartite motif-containing protein 2-like isoform X1 n=1 Tax=Ptychodera flava TaxID=63121 RepID=UPI00396A8974
MHQGKVRQKISKTSRNIKQTETLATQTKRRSLRKRKPIHESDKTINPKMARGEEIRSGQCKQSKQEQTEINKNGHIKIKQTKQQTQRTKKISSSERKQQPVDSTTARDNTYSNAFTVHVGLTEKFYQQQMRDLDRQVQTRSIRKKKEQLKAAWEKIKAEMDKTECEAITNNNSVQRVDQNCRDNFGEVSVTSMKLDSLAISLDLPTLYNLYRLKQTCLSGSFPDSFEPLLITDKMREEADKVGLQLKLKATYDQARFDELELFFINRDGGGLEPVKLYDDFNVANDAEEITVPIDDEDTVTDQTSDTMVTERVDSSSQTEQGESLDDIQSKYEMETLESQLKEAKEEKGTLEERCKELTQKLESTEQSLVSQRIGNSVEREKLQSELKENQKLVKELQNKVDELEYKLELSDLKKSGEKGDWSMTLVNGQHQGKGQKFKIPRGLAFHRDKLVVCDSDNNIVQILNKDYTCDKVIGSFDGQFAKPFRPLSVAISRFNHYFILDDENKQIVVCDENGKIIKIITLPENTEEVWDIALMDDFVLVTLRLTSPDTSVRPEDRGDRLVKYTQSGEYLAEVNGQISGQGQFYWPMSVVVNSNNVIMVYDSGNGCIKCFDSDLNFLHQFGQSQIPGGIVGYIGYIAVDEDDNVYVCDYFFDRIVKYRCDGKWICNLLEGNVSGPEYIAVMGDKIGVVERGRYQIKVFSK